MSEPYHGLGAAAAIIALACCGASKSDDAPAPAETPPVASEGAEKPSKGCKRAVFAESIDLAEASGVTPVPEVGVLVVSDSGNRGAYQVLDGAGKAIESTSVPLDRVTDDIEGLTWDASRELVVGLSSSGIVFEYRRHEGEFELARKPYPIEDDSDCAASSVNCGLNWEGICIGAIGHEKLAGCVGAAASKQTGELFCLTRTGSGELALDRDRRLYVTPRGTLSGCSIDGRGTVWAATNVLSGNKILEITADSIEKHSSWIIGNLEAIAVTESSDAGVELVAFSDSSRSPSRAFRYRCGRTL